jgi:hypothetical protein
MKTPLFEIMNYVRQACQIMTKPKTPGIALISGIKISAIRVIRGIFHEVFSRSQLRVLKC